MQNTTPQTVVLGVTGCIAAYKACTILRMLQRGGLRVKVVMTEAATRFVGPTTFRALTREPVAVSLWDTAGAPVHHVSLAQEASVVLIAPATANTIARLASGTADDLLTTMVLASDARLVIAPAMNDRMWAAPATQENISRLRERGAIIVAPGDGDLACGTQGSGRLADEQLIVDATIEALHSARSMEGISVLVTAGGTREPIDPVRFIGNRSSGITGHLYAEEAVARGASVTLVTTTDLPVAPGVKRVCVESAHEMHQAVDELFDACDVFIATAAVADFAPTQTAQHKLKKDSGPPIVSLTPTVDILASVAARKGDRVVVGYAAETDDVLAHARRKRDAKGVDVLVANDVSDPQLGFGTPDNEVWLVTSTGEEHVPRSSKRAIAQTVLDRVESIHATRG